MNKTCTLCGEDKPEDAFEPRRKQCKTCRQEKRNAKRKEKKNSSVKAPRKPVESVSSPEAVTPPTTTDASVRASQAPLRADEGDLEGVEALRQDFRKFTWVIWKHLGLPDPTPTQYDIAHFIANGPDRICVQAFRGVGKSFLTAAYVAWELWKNPQKKIMVISATKVRADDFSTFLLRLIHEVPLLRHLRPREGQRASKISFDVGPATADQSPSVKSVGITGQLTGSRADIIVSDDVEVVGNSATADMREKLLALTKEYSAILKPLPTSRIIYLGTPQTEDSIYNKLSEVFTTRIWPARIPSQSVLEGYRGALAPRVAKMCGTAAVGDPVDPERFDSEDLRVREADYGKAGFALQFMLNTQLTDMERFPLKVKDLVFMDVQKERAPMKVEWLPDPERRIKDMPNVAMAGDHMFHFAGASKEWKEYEGSLLAIDPSGRGKDETGYAVIKMLNGQLFVRKCGGLPGGYDEDTLTKLSKIAKEEDVNHVLVEDNFGDGMYIELLKPVMKRHHNVTIEGQRNSTQKERRIIDVLEPVMSRHKLVFNTSLIKEDYDTAQKYDSEVRISKTLIYQMTRISYDRGALRHDDRLDALAIGVSYWTDRMARDQDEQLKIDREEALDRELDRFMENALGVSFGGPRNDNWIS